MRSNKTISTTSVWQIWGWLDVMCIWWFASESMRHGNIPYFGAAESLFRELNGHPALQLSIALMYLLLHLSIIVSCVLFLRMSKSAKWWAYAQTPLRFILVVPSVSPLAIGLDALPFYHYLIIPSVLIFSELLKGATLWGRSFELKEGSQERSEPSVSELENSSESSLSEVTPPVSYPKGKLSFFWIAVVIIVPLILIEAVHMYKTLTRGFYNPYM